MEEINARIRKAREAVGASQENFAKKANRTRSEITNIEYGKTIPKDEVISALCSAWGISELWLRTGEGEIFVALTRGERIAFEVGRLLSDESAEFKRALIGALLAMDETGWNALENLIREIVNGEKKEG